VRGLTPGQTYAASAWVQITGKRDAAIAVEAGVAEPAPFMDKQTWKIASSTKRYGGDRPSNVLDGNPATLWHTAEAQGTTNAFPHHITINFGRELTLEGFVQTARENLGNGTIKEYEAWISTDNRK